MSGGIRLNPTGLETSASAAAARALAIDQVTAAIAGVSTGGLEPRTLGRTVAALTRSATLTQRASGLTGKQGPVLRKRAALARAADGGGWQPKKWDPLKWTAQVSLGVLDAYSKTADLHDLRSKKGWAKELHGRKGPVGGWHRNQFKAWQDLAKGYKQANKWNARRLSQIRAVARINVKHRLIEAAKAKFMLPSPPKKGIFGKLKGLPGKAAGKAFGPVLAVANSIRKGEPIKVVVQRAGAAAAGALVDAAIVAAGGALCAGVVISTAGVGALACPAIVGGTAAVAGIATGAVINHQIDKQKKADAAREAAKPKPPPKIVLPQRRYPSTTQCVPEYPRATARPAGAV